MDSQPLHLRDALATTPAMVSRIYQQLTSHLKIIRERLNRPLTMAEKILLGHVSDPNDQELVRGQSYLRLKVDRVIMQDATAQMAILQFMQSGRKRVAVPTTIHCDHLIRASQGAREDRIRALGENREVFDFLSSTAKKFGMGFWEPGTGIIHQVVLENYSFPGGLMIGSDSHTPNMGGVGMIAIGVGGADAMDAMVGLHWDVLMPRLIGVYLTGSLKGWTAPKDVILKVASELTVKGGTNCIIEYLGPGVKTLSATGRATITNMGAEIGATTSIFPCDERTAEFLAATGRVDLADLSLKNAHLLRADDGVEENLSAYFDRVLEIDLDRLEPLIVGPFSPDLARPVSELKLEVERKGYPPHISHVLIGSCTNSSYEDLTRAAAVAAQANAVGASSVVPLMITPGSAQIFETVRRDGVIACLESVGAQVMANACGPCIGQWERKDTTKGQKNTIVNSYNRNFPGRNDDNPNTYAFVASPEVALAYSLCGDLRINPLTDELHVNGHTFRLEPPAPTPALPPRGYVFQTQGYQTPAENPDEVQVVVPEGSVRLQVLEPFGPMVAPEFAAMPVLMKTRGKTTTDHISPAGKWLRFRGHLDKISDNLLSGAINAWTGEQGKTLDVISGERGLTPAQVARHYKAEGRRWVIVGDENYGEGSSREHAAMSPRYLGAAAVIARSFARIHESNLKKQGILPLTFSDPRDYDKIREGDVVNLEYLQELDPVRSVNMLICHGDDQSEVVVLKHNMTLEQLGWFHAGSALNLIRKQQTEETGTSEASPKVRPPVW